MLPSKSPNKIKAFEIKYLIITNVESTSEEIHIYFKMERRDHVCPCCGAVTNKVYDYRPSIIKDAPIMGKNTYLHYSKRRQANLKNSTLH